MPPQVSEHLKSSMTELSQMIGTDTFSSPADDVQLEKPVPYISSRTSQTAYYTHAYQWLGASALSVQELAKASPDVTKLWKKTDSVTLFALGKPYRVD